MKKKETAKGKIRIFQKLSTKFVIGFCILAVLILTASCTIGYYEYKSNVEKLYNTTAYAVANEARSLIDGERIKEYTQTLRKDDEYETMRNNLETLRQNMDVVSIFVVKLDDEQENTYNYIFDTIESPAAPMNLGDKAEFPIDFKTEIENVYYEGKDLSDEYIYIQSSTYGYNSFALVPVYDDSNSIVAMVFVQSSVGKIKDTLRQYVMYAVSLTILLVIVFLLIYLTYLNKKVITPIKKITAHSLSFVNEEKELSASMEKVHTGDEIETLADSLIQMENDIHQYVENLALATATKEHMTAEFNVAQQMQQNLFPCQFPAFPERNDFDIYAELQSCDSIGGNFYNFFLTDENHLCVLLGDVSGNGIPTSMFSVIATTLISHYAAQNLTPDKILFNVNNDLSKNNHAELTVEAFLAIINLSTGELSYSTAGNMNMLLKSPGSGFEPLPFKKCFPLAAMEQVHYSLLQTTLSQGDILFLHTKGIAEAVNEKGLLFGADYAKEKITELVGREYSLKNMTEQFLTFVEDFQEGTIQAADSTVLLFRYIGR
jgi:sigma-B regulation protein RsbU (phosphoserine phosphatase)